MKFSGSWKSLGATMSLLLSTHWSSALSEPIRVGWQTPWAVQGQVVMGLMKTEIGKANGLDLSFYGFFYGAPLNQAAISGNVDIVLTADQPALALLAHSDDFVIVARLMYNRVCIYSPPAGTIRSLGDLTGKKVSGPVGAAAERIALDKIAAAGAVLETITFGSLDMAHQAALLKTAGPGAKKWSGVDALYGFDPLPAAFEEANLARMLDCGKVLSVVLARKSFVEGHPRQAESFMCSFVASWYQFAVRPVEMNSSFIAVSGLDVTQSMLDRAAELEPNRWAKSRHEFRFDFVDADFELMNSANAFLVGRGIIPVAVDVKARIDLRPLKAALTSDTCLPILNGVPYPVTN